MSEQNLSQHWKRYPLNGTQTGDNFFNKADITREESSSSTFPMPAENFSESQFDLQKLSSISKINSLVKLSGINDVSQIPEEERLRKVQQIVESSISDHAQQQILQILDKVSLLKPPERLLLYLRLPSGTPETDPLRQPQNPLGTRSEINHTINWVRSHLEHDPKVSIPKQDVYNDYIAYCDRVDIKPLSTADFGKVMKQVFPEIRPRRLGTRGHSRYCYAAMRKATKLEPPCLPILGMSADSYDFNGFMDEDSWKIVKAWAESLLNSTFDSLKELANHITNHHINSPASNSSRLLLQKKLLQREVKDKRKFLDNSPVKKKRKKKRRSSSSSESTHNAVLSPGGSMGSIKSENSGSSKQLTNQVQYMGSQLSQQPQHVLPMNLVTDSNNLHKIQGTNLACDNSLVVGCTTKNLIAQNSSPNNTSIVKGELTPIPELSIVKEEIPEDYHSDILCKKVRQAQQTKGLWIQSQNINISQNNSLITNDTNSNDLQINQKSTAPIMGPPAQIDISTDSPNNTGLKRCTNSNGTAMGGTNLQFRSKKIRYLQSRLDALHMETQSSNLGSDNDKDVLPDNLGIPRERVISICNMDKHELDGYLNEEENYQDQEAELLQYFQVDGSENRSSNQAKCNELLSGNSNLQSCLDNFQTFDSSKDNKKSILMHEQDEINQLRYYLYQNLQNNKMTDGQIVNKHPIEPIVTYSNLHATTLASASLTMMSQRHLTLCNNDNSNVKSSTHNNRTGNMIMNSSNSSLKNNRRKINMNLKTCTANSPNTKLKNFSFVPISPNTNIQTSIEYSPFVSPRSTPIVKKQSLHKLQSLPATEHNFNESLIPASNSSYGKNITFSSAISASAPSSPSLIQQRFRFVTSSSIASPASTSLTNCTDVNFSHFQTLDNQSRNLSSNNCNLDETNESRSQSVPPHYRNSPGFNQSNNLQGFASECSSVTQTPVPSEFADFNDPSSLLDILNDSSQQRNPVKLESNDIRSSFLDEITSTESGVSIQTLELTNEFNPKCESLVSNISRSVPSTPLPNINYKCKNTSISNNHSNNNKSNKLYDISKSVPTTPIAMSVAPFRYSPDFNRDFLINGNTVESGKFSSFYNQQQQAQQQPQIPSQNNLNDSVAEKVITTTLADGIDELSNFGDVTDSIIGSDILSNL